MKIDNFKIQIIDNGDGCYTAFLDHEDFRGIVVQTNSLHSIPEELSLSFRAMLQYAMEENNYSITKFNYDKQN